MLLLRLGTLYLLLQLHGEFTFAKPGPSDEQRLVDYLLNGYNKHARPVANSSNPVLVQIKFHLLQLSKLDEREQLLTTFAWMKMEWTDEYMVWNTSDYGGLTSVVVPALKVWLPDVTLQNSAEEMYDEIYDEKFRVEVFSSGQVVWFPGGKMTTQCSLDVTYYPFDDQKCSLELVNWAYNIYQVNLTNKETTVDMSEYAESGEWAVLKTEAKTTYTFHEEEPGVPFPKVHFNLFLRRKSTYHMINVVIPCLIMSLLSLIVFWLPADSGEKVSLGITVLLSFAVYLVLIEENMPKTSDYMPAITIYVTVVMALSAASLIFTVMVLSLHHHSQAKNMPNWMRKLIFGILAKIVCMRQSNPSGVSGVKTVNQSLISMGSDPDLEKKQKVSNTDVDTNNLSEILMHVRTITETIRSKERESVILDEWRSAGRVLDSFFFLVVTVLTASFSIIFLGLYPLAEPSLID